MELKLISQGHANLSIAWRCMRLEFRCVAAELFEWVDSGLLHLTNGRIYKGRAARLWFHFEMRLCARVHNEMGCQEIGLLN